MKKITIDRSLGCEDVSRESWKDLISALVLVGYEVYGDEGSIQFNLSNDDKVQEIEK